MDPAQFNHDAGVIAVARGAVCYWCDKGPEGWKKVDLNANDTTSNTATQMTTRSKARRCEPPTVDHCTCKWCGTCGNPAVYEYDGGNAPRYRCGSKRCNANYVK